MCVCLCVKEGVHFKVSQEIEEMCYSSLGGCFHSDKLVGCVASPGCGVKSCNGYLKIQSQLG